MELNEAIARSIRTVGVGATRRVIEAAMRGSETLPCVYFGPNGGAPRGRHAHLTADSPECNPLFEATETTKEG